MRNLSWTLRFHLIFFSFFTLSFTVTFLFQQDHINLLLTTSWYDDMAMEKKWKKKRILREKENTNKQNYQLFVRQRPSDYIHDDNGNRALNWQLGESHNRLKLNKQDVVLYQAIEQSQQKWTT